ncbi:MULTISPECIES: CmpA/NrtA family ABC transporter substrate-binding protein [unclassified Leptolyngbya]|uniref:CmpA/NrtA family ABC transporter substrate-binding protein n=1 Tax=unclassified Leptolyngbya TaxID=2650499 RepID=UPI001686602C|nr:MULTISPECIES: CmpA/NrtA family ABC transporter substrate-binding protein [unclassified Leptolyngbya]MBD1913540.1 ABC transporter substrate-binding protein [Leptolyngbya sp. FACHB-8]MBD2155889.1 ABC transporter substrate-binding protein [Leptolyngbya sp. FACHB-16]
MSDFSRVTRRKFLFTAGASAAGAVFLKGCVGNPPGSTPVATTGNTTTAPATTAGTADTPETTTIKLGYVPIVESAPLVVALEKGFFAKYGMTGAEVLKQANWGSARDNVEIGAAAGGIDGGQWQMPMPHLISEGIITKGNQKIPMYVLSQLNTQGNGIAIAKKHLGKGIGLDLSKAKDYILSLKSAGTPFKAAYTFPKANQDFWIRYWFAAGGINPDTDISLLAVPSAQTVANMKTGTMDAFSTGDPWPYRIVADDIGFMSALTAQIWPDHPEEYLAIRADWVDANPKATKAVLMAVMEAQQWCDDPANREELSTILAGRNYFNLPKEILSEPYKGMYKMGDGQPDINDTKMATLYWKDSKGSVSYPYKSHDLWFLTESVRWGFLPASTMDNAQKIVDSVNREDLWKEAAQALGIASSDIPSNTSRGVETFFDGKTFDPSNPKAYLESLEIKKV